MIKYYPPKGGRRSPQWLLSIWGLQRGWGGTATGWGRGEFQVSATGVRYIAHVQMVDQLSAQVVLLLTLTLQRLQRLLQLTIWDVLQTHCILELTVQDFCFLFQDFELVLQALKLHLEGQEEDFVESCMFQQLKGLTYLYLILFEGWYQFL